MAKKRKVRYDRLIMIAVVVIALVIALFFGIRFILNKKTNEEVKPDPKPPVITEELPDLEIKCLDYQVYPEDDELGFGFIVADLKFTSSASLAYDFVNLKTGENLLLNDTYHFENKLRTSGYLFDDLGVENSLDVEDKEKVLKVFIPFEKSTNSLLLNDLKYNNSILFDLAKNHIALESLKPISEQEQIKTSSYLFTCSKPYKEDMMKHNGEPYDASMLATYTFKLTCNEIGDHIKITKAEFKDKNGEEFSALDSTYNSSKIDNILDKEIKVGDTYALFFELFAGNEESVIYDGVLTLTFSDGSVAEVKAVLD